MVAVRWDGGLRPLALLAGASFLALAVFLAALGPSSGAYHLGHSGPAADSSTDLAALWAIPPVEVAGVIVLGALYVVWARRSGGVSGTRQASFLAGLAAILIAVVSPLGGIAQQGLLSAHMLQHTLIGAVAPLLLLLGVPATSIRGLAATTRRRLGLLAHPVLAFSLWVIGTVVWLLPAVHHAVLMSSPLWVLQQVSFLALGLVMWAPIIEPLPAPAWFGTAAKGLYMSGVWTVGLIIANVYWFSGTAFYRSHAEAAVAWGLSPLEDQGHAGTVMMVLHCLLAFGAIAVLFFRQAREEHLAQRLIDAGIEPSRVAEATRRGVADALARERGIPVRTRAGID